MNISVDETSVNFISTRDVVTTLESSDILACFVSVPDKHHRFYSELCMKRGIPLWLVKPLCCDWDDAQALVEMQNSTNARVWVDYHKRFDTSNAWLKIKANRGDMGRMLAYSVDYHQPRTLPIDVFNWTRDVDVFSYIGCHYVDQVFYLYPEAKLISASAEPLKGIVYQETGQFDGVLATLNFETNAGPLLCPMNVGWFNPEGSPTKSLQTIKAQFERGVVSLDQTRRGVHVWADEGVSEVNPYFFGETLNLNGSVEFAGYGYESVGQFLDNITNREAWPTDGCVPTLSEAAKTEFVLHAVQQSLMTGQKFVVV
jgi:predicted dehydrogenase